MDLDTMANISHGYFFPPLFFPLDLPWLLPCPSLCFAFPTPVASKSLYFSGSLLLRLDLRTLVKIASTQ